MARNGRRAFEEWGYTNDPQHIADVRAWIAAAVADGWAIEPTYEHESVERAASLTRDGFKVMAIMRDAGEDGDRPRNYRYEAKVSAWAPDGLGLIVPDHYDWPTLRAAINTCSLCGATNVETVRYSFAGRCCNPCVPKARAEYERGNWTA